VSVPNRFATVRQWCEVIAHNLLAEFYYQYQQVAQGGGGGQGRLSFVSHNPTELTVGGADGADDNYVHNLLLINRCAPALAVDRCVPLPSERLEVDDSLNWERRAIC